MRRIRSSLLVSMIGGALVACSQSSDVPTAARVAFGQPSPTLTGGGGFQFSPLAASAVCTPGGNPDAPFIVPARYSQAIVASEPDVPDAIDMNTQNETGPFAGRYLYRPAEGAIGAVTVTDLATGITKQLAFRPDWESMDPIVWTPWGTILVGEEATVATKKNPHYPNAIGGLMYEIFLNPHDPTTADSVVARPALGAKAHEGNRFDAQGNHCGVSENNPGFIFKFTPDRRGDLSSGQLFALKITEPTGDRTGGAEWIPLDRAAVQIDARAVALAAGATGYNRPDDIEIATSSGNSRDGANTLYVAVTSPTGPVDNRVLAIDLRAPRPLRDADRLRCRATGIYFDVRGWGLFVNAQHRGGDHLDKAVLITRQ